MTSTTPIPQLARNFASDNNAGIAPHMLEALLAVNTGHCPSYGEDEWTRRSKPFTHESFLELGRRLGDVFASPAS